MAGKARGRAGGRVVSTEQRRDDEPSMEAGREVYQAGYLTQRRGSFRTPCPHPDGSWQQRAWNQGFDHAAYTERHGLTHPTFL